MLATIYSYQGSLSDCNEALNLDANFTKALKRAAKCCIITGQFDVRCQRLNILPLTHFSRDRISN